jgi:murein DD-endopeptidase MepM/ murein hydrolase activator NlpD
VLHVVQAGDTISGLAYQYDVPEADIIAANNLENPNVLQVGMELIIPMSGPDQITPTWTPNPTPTDTSIPFEPPSAALTATALALGGSNATSVLGATGVVGGPVQVEIEEVIAAGNSDREAVVIVNRGKQVADMRDWTLSDANGNVYVFKDLRLWPGGSATVNTRVGEDNNPAFNFYWGKLQSIWSTGEAATLRDAAGTVVAEYTVE